MIFFFFFSFKNYFSKSLYKYTSIKKDQGKQQQKTLNFLATYLVSVLWDSGPCKVCYDWNIRPHLQTYIIFPIPEGKKSLSAEIFHVPIVGRTQTPTSDRTVPKNWWLYKENMYKEMQTQGNTRKIQNFPKSPTHLLEDEKSRNIFSKYSFRGTSFPWPHPKGELPKVPRLGLPIHYYLLFFIIIYYNLLLF